jgi:signal transduction histidine kinase/DNA-binding response OmpR family regulator
VCAAWGALAGGLLLVGLGAVLGLIRHERLTLAAPARADARRSEPGLRPVVEDNLEYRVLEAARAEAQAASDAKSRFLVGMSHGLRTPLSGILGVADLLVDSEPGPEQSEYARTIKSSAEAVATLLNDVVDITRIESGLVELDQGPFDLAQCLESVIDVLAHRAEEKGLELTCLVDADVPLGLVGDQARLRQVLLNLVDNAIQFTEAGEVHLYVSTRQVGDEHCTLNFLVEDTGCGIAEAAQATLFEPFSETAGGATRRTGGTGLGLAICSRLASMMDGSIAVDSQVGEGSSFSLSVRFGVAREASPASGSECAGLAGLRLLVVDDNATARRVVRQYAEGCGLEVEEAPDAHAALEAMNRASRDGRPFDIATLDLEMPDMDGKELASHVKVDQALRGTRLVLLKSLGRPERASSLARMGFEAWISKPVSAGRLRTALAHVTANPDAASVTPAAAAAALPATGEAEPASGLEVLVVEDNVVNQRVATLLLRNLGCNVRVANDGRSAVDLLVEETFDLVFMDCQMPVLSGYDATREIRGMEDGEKQSVPIVAMTANAMRGDRERCLAAGMDDYLAKPVRADELAQMLEKWKNARSDNGLHQRCRENVMNDNNEEILDRDVLESLRELGGEDDPEMFLELVELFLDDTPPRIAALERALDAGDAEAVEQAAHALKSSCANLGATKLSSLLREIEYAGKENDLDRAGSLARNTGDEYRAVEQALRAELS